MNLEEERKAFDELSVFEKDGNIISFLACEFLEEVSNE